VKLNKKLLTIIVFLTLTSCTASLEPKSNQINQDKRAFVLAEAKAEKAVQICMKSKGWKYYENPAPFVPVAFSEEFALLYGYGISILPPTRSVSERNVQLYESLNAEDRVTYSRDLGDSNGPSGEGCRSLGERSMRTTLPLYTLSGLEALATQGVEARRDPQFRALVNKWSKCMSVAGYGYSSPEEMTQGLTTEFETLNNDRLAVASFSERELSVAKADVACRRSSGVSASLSKVAQDASKLLASQLNEPDQ
jgi:hypothetical protein